jgi:hypothetical protein
MLSAITSAMGRQHLYPQSCIASGRLFVTLQLLATCAWDAQHCLFACALCCAAAAAGDVGTGALQCVPAAVLAAGGATPAGCDTCSTCRQAQLAGTPPGITAALAGCSCSGTR